MDGVSAAASVVTLVETSLKVVSLCVEYYSTSRMPIISLNSSVGTFRPILHAIMDLAVLSSPAVMYRSKPLRKRRKLFRPVSGINVWTTAMPSIPSYLMASFLVCFRQPENFILKPL